ncbi:putative lipid kinase [compost metagenome]
MKITLVYNPKSGSARPLQELRNIFDTHGITITRAVPIKKHFKAALKAPIENGECIAVIGGDGTISAVASLVVGTKATLIPLPGGTLNHFTKDLGIDQDLMTAVANVKTARPRTIDIGSVNTLFFINNSSIGLYPSSLHARKRLEDTLGKWPAAVIGSLRALMRYRTYDVEINGQRLSTPFVFVGNNDYKLDAFGPEGRTTLAEGVLSVYIVNALTRWALVKVFAHALIGKLDILSDFIALKTTSFTITSTHARLSVSRDGEVSRVRTPLTYSIKKAQLRIL